MFNNCLDCNLKNHAKTLPFYQKYLKIIYNNLIRTYLFRIAGNTESEFGTYNNERI